MIVNNKFTRAYNVLLVRKKKKKQAGEVNVLKEEQYEIASIERTE